MARSAATPRVSRLDADPAIAIHRFETALSRLLGMRSDICDAVCDCPTGKSAKTCLSPRAKIFRFRSHPNHRHNSARLTADEGRWPSSRTRGEMRWTRRRDRRARPERTAKSCGSDVAVLALRSGEAKLLWDNGGKRAVLREEHEVSRKAIAQGRPECSRCPVCSCAVLFAQIARETAGAASTRSSLRPLTKRAGSSQTSGAITSRDRGLTFSRRHPRRRVTQYSRDRSD